MFVSIMQPYFFPYIGYFQLMAACDLFVVFDDVQYIRRGWVNRNRILVNGEPQWITLPVAGDDYFLPINQRVYLLDDRLAQRMRRRIVGAYRAAPHFTATMQLIDEILSFGDANVARFNTHLLTRVARHLGIDTPVRIASSIEKNHDLAGESLVIDICQRLGATGYINPIGGLALYHPARFAAQGLTLRFLQPEVPAYPQYGLTPVPSLSIIDVLMFNTPDDVRRLLSCHRLISGQEGGVPD